MRRVAEIGEAANQNRYHLLWNRADMEVFSANERIRFDPFIKAA
jgi:hypothetical protein